MKSTDYSVIHLQQRLLSDNILLLSRCFYAHMKQNRPLLFTYT